MKKKGWLLITETDITFGVFLRLLCNFLLNMFFSALFSATKTLYLIVVLTVKEINEEWSLTFSFKSSPLKLQLMLSRTKACFHFLFIFPHSQLIEVEKMFKILKSKPPYIIITVFLY